MAKKRSGFENRAERRAGMNESNREKELEKIAANSLPTHIPMLDFMLANLRISVTTLKELGWSNEEIVNRIIHYAEIYAQAAGIMDLVFAEKLPPEEESLRIQVVSKEIIMNSYEDDLNDEAVQRTIGFLQSEEAQPVLAEFGFK